MLANVRYVFTKVTREVTRESLEIKIKPPLHANKMQSAITVKVKLKLKGR